MPVITPPKANTPAPKAGFHLTLGARLRTYFLAGILITAPIGLTIYLARLVISFIATVGNYDYGFYWYLYQDGTIRTFSSSGNSRGGNRGVQASRHDRHDHHKDDEHDQQNIDQWSYVDFRREAVAPRGASRRECHRNHLPMLNWVCEHSIAIDTGNLQKAPGGWPTGHTARMRA